MAHHFTQEVTGLPSATNKDSTCLCCNPVT